MSRPKKRKKKLLPQLKKDIKDFCFSEEGKISKRAVVKMGLTLAVLSASVKALEANHGSHAQTQTRNDFYYENTGGHYSGPVVVHSSHGSHTSHGSHGQW